VNPNGQGPALVGDRMTAPARATGGMILLVEDEESVGTLVRTYLDRNGFRVCWVRTGEEALAEFTRHPIRLVVLDIGLPGIDGFEVCRRLRSRSAIPIIMLTARDEEPDRVAGLEVGADDYVTKPFAFRELVARVRALARRRPALVPRVATIADLEVDLSSRQVQRAGRPIELTAKEFALLEFFVLHRGEVVDRAAITAHVWDDNHDPFTNVLEVLVRRLRRKIDDPFEPKLIQTLRGAGYRFAE
jgi:two-component system copper resistance phosphate regulon response regulator CusR